MQKVAESIEKAPWSNELRCTNVTDEDGNPTGGGVTSVGLAIDWQNGPLGRGAERREPTGAFVEDVVLAALQRVRFYQASKFACEENGHVIEHLERALKCMQVRHEEREARQVQGLHEA